MCLLMGEGMACGGLPFPGTGCPIPDVDYLCLLCIDFYVWDAVFTFNSHKNSNFALMKYTLRASAGMNTFNEVIP